MTSAITLAEISVGPLRAGNPVAAETYRTALTRSPRWTMRAIDDQAAVLAARLRVKYRLKLPDALQVAVAVTDRCDAFVTADGDFDDVDEIRIIRPT